MYELNETISESKEHIEQKKEAIKEGVKTCLTYLRPMTPESHPITPTVNPKKKIILKKKSFNILQHESDEEAEEEENEEDDKENQTMTPVLDENMARRKTVRGSNSSKRSVSSKQEEDESPSKRTKTVKDIDEPLPIISPTVTKRSTPGRKKKNDEGEAKKVKSLRLARKVQDSKSMESTKLIQKQKSDEINSVEEADVRAFSLKRNQFILSISGSRKTNCQ